MSTRLVVGLIAPLALLGAQGASDWKTFTAKEGRFSVLLPGSPIIRKQDVKTPAGTVSVTFYVLEKDGVTYVASYSEFPKGKVKPGTEKGRLDNARDGAVASAGGKLEAETQIKLEKYPGRELLIKGPSFVRTRIFAVQNRLYQTMVVGSKEWAQGKEASRFLDSLKFTR